MRTSLASLAVVATLSLAACTSVPAQPVDSAPAGSNQPAQTSSTPSANTPKEGVAAFGSSYTWEDGLSLTLGTPEPYTPSEYAYTGSQFTDFVVVDVRLVNNTGSPWDPALTHASAQSSNQEGDQVFDSAKLPDQPRTTLLDGREATYKMAFAVADPSDLVLEFTPDWGHASVIFQR